MRRIFIFTLIAVSLIAWLSLKSNALIFYKITETRGDSRHTGYRADFSSRIFVDYLKRKAGLVSFSGAPVSKEDFNLSEKEQEGIKKILRDGAVKAEEMASSDADMGEEIQKMIDSYRKIMDTSHNIE